MIVKYPACEGSDDILLIAVTFDHDHERMKSLIKEHRSEIDRWRSGNDES